MILSKFYSFWLKNLLINLPQEWENEVCREEKGEMEGGNGESPQEKDTLVKKGAREAERWPSSIND